MDKRLKITVWPEKMPQIPGAVRLQDMRAGSGDVGFGGGGGTGRGCGAESLADSPSARSPHHHRPTPTSLAWQKWAVHRGEAAPAQSDGPCAPNAVPSHVADCACEGGGSPNFGSGGESGCTAQVRGRGCTGPGNRLPNGEALTGGRGVGTRVLHISAARPPPHNFRDLRLQGQGRSNTRYHP